MSERRVVYSNTGELIDGVVARAEEAGRLRALAAQTDKLERQLEALDVAELRREALPLIDQAIAAGVVPRNQREETFRAYAASPEATKRMLTASLPPPSVYGPPIDSDEELLLNERFEATFKQMFGERAS